MNKNPPVIPVLFCEKNGIYANDPRFDAWDIGRDARNYKGDSAVIAHPPCPQWSAFLAHCAHPNPSEKNLALWAVELVRRVGGVLEHPAWSTLFATAQLPLRGGLPDEFGGITLQVDQFDFGHPCRKRTWLYIVRLGIFELPPLPAKRFERPQFSVGGKKRLKHGVVTVAGQKKRNATPPLFADWLYDVASQIEANKLRRAA